MLTTQLCDILSDRTLRDKAIRNLNFQIFNCANAGKLHNPSSLLKDFRQRPLDVVLLIWCYGQSLVVDLTTVLRLQTVLVSDASEQNGSAAKFEERKISAIEKKVERDQQRCFLFHTIPGVALVTLHV